MTRSLQVCVLSGFVLSSMSARALALPGVGDEFPAQRAGLSFVENKGQWPAAVCFAAGFGPASVWVVESGAVVDLRRSVVAERGRGCALRFDFVDGSSAGEGVVRASGETQLEGHHNYFMGNDPNAWVVGARRFARLRFSEAWPGIDVVLREGAGLFEYDLELAADADLRAVRIHVSGASGLDMDEQGRLLVHSEAGTLTQSAPLAWAVEGDGTRRPVTCRFQLRSDDSFGFESDDLPSGEAWVIDPGVLWSTYLGDLDYDVANAVALTSSGDAISVGSTLSIDYPHSPGAYDFTWNGSLDAFVTRLKDHGAVLAYSTFLGGATVDTAMALALAANDDVIVVGETDSPDFPTTAGAFDVTPNGALDAFVARLDANGALLKHSTRLGGAAIERVTGVVLDASERPILCGSTGAASFPTTGGSFDNSFGGGSTGIGDAFVARFASDLSALDFSTFLGGEGNERAEALALGADGRITVAGWTDSLTFPVTFGVVGPTLTGGLGQEGFVSRLEANGQALTWSTYLGGTAFDAVQDVALFANEDCALVGYTLSADFPSGPNAVQPALDAQEEGFVLRLKSDASQFEFATFLGGNGQDRVEAVTLFANQALAVTGRTTSTNLGITAWAYDINFAGSSGSPMGDAFVFRYDPLGQLDYATYLGGLANDTGLDITSDGQGGVLLCGETNSGDFPMISGSFDTGYDGTSVSDGFLSRFDFAHYPFEYGSPKINSLGGWAQIIPTGYPSVTSNNFVLWSAGAISGSYGVFFWSDQRGALPIAGGELLMLPPLHRGPIVNFDILGFASHPVVMDASLIGTTRFYQLWYHDAGDPFGFGLSSGVEMLFYP